MNAQYENNFEYSFIYLNIRPNEREKALSTAEMLESYGEYEIVHIDSEVVQVCCTQKKTIAEMREDYSEAKRGLLI